MRYQESERATYLDRRNGKERRKAERRKGERRKQGIDIELMLRGIAIRRCGEDRRQGDRREADHRNTRCDSK